MEPQTVKRTVLSDSLESELNTRSPDSWRFEVRETTCCHDNCDCELLAVAWFGHGLTPEHIDKPMVKTWYTEEVRRRKDMGNFAQAVLDQLAQIVPEEE
jgi:hypothetical protein